MNSDEEKMVRTLISSESQRLRVTANQLRAHFSAQDADSAPAALTPALPWSEVRP